MTIEIRFKDKFSQSDSVLIYDIGENAIIEKFGYPLNEEEELIIIK